MSGRGWRAAAPGGAIFNYIHIYFHICLFMGVLVVFLVLFLTYGCVFLWAGFAVGWWGRVVCVAWCCSTWEDGRSPCCDEGIKSAEREFRDRVSREGTVRAFRERGYRASVPRERVPSERSEREGTE